MAAAIGIFLLLQVCFGSWRLATFAFLTLPSALVGGVLAAVFSIGVISACSTDSLVGPPVVLEDVADFDVRDQCGGRATHVAQFDAIILGCFEIKPRPRPVVRLRLGWVADRLWLDMTTPEPRAIEITPNGWSIISDPPVHLVYSQTAKPLPMPA